LSKGYNGRWVIVKLVAPRGVTRGRQARALTPAKHLIFYYYLVFKYGII
jgi:hypothetical protein